MIILVNLFLRNFIINSRHNNIKYYMMLNTIFRVARWCNEGKFFIVTECSGINKTYPYFNLMVQLEEKPPGGGHYWNLKNHVR